MKSAGMIAGIIAPLLMDPKKIKRIKNLAYGPLPEQILDIYMPVGDQINLPITLLIHGGGFSYFSKNSHATAAHQLAMDGRLVFNIDYRMTPKHPYPSGLNDAISAYDWIVINAEKWGGDLNHISLVGESAGGNYSLGICLNLLMNRTSNAHVPKKAVIHCGHLYVSNVDRYTESESIHPVVKARVVQIKNQYLPETQGLDLTLADPLLVIEDLVKNQKPLPDQFPKIFVPVGDADPVRGDSIRLSQALENLGQKNTLKTYPGEVHAFYVLPFSKRAGECWVDILAFLNAP